MSFQRAMPAEIDLERLIGDVCGRLTRNKQVRRRLPGGGRLHIDRPLPFVCVHRFPDREEPDGTEQLITTEASYLIASGDPAWQSGISQLCRRIVPTLAEQFDAILLLEVWAAQDDAEHGLHFRPPQPAFRIVTAQHDELPSTVQALARSLGEISIDGRHAKVAVAEADVVAPPGLPPLIAGGAGERRSCFRVGLEVAPIYHSRATGESFPLLLRLLRRSLARALKQSFCAFAGLETRHPPVHFESLGRRALVRAVGSADQRLCQVADAFDLLLLVTPLNPEPAWQEFQQRGFRVAPSFDYRPLPFSPDLLKRRLFSIPLERIEDPTLAHLLHQKFPEEVRPQTLITRDRGEVQKFVRELGGKAVLKPLEGSGGQNVFLVRKEDGANLNQMIDAVCRDGYVIVQEFLPAAEKGDTRLFLINGFPLEHQGKYAAMARHRSGADLRSNMHAGGKAGHARVDAAALRIAGIVRPKLVHDGMFLVGLDIVGDKLMEINVFSPGGLHSFKKLTGINFFSLVLEAIGRKVECARRAPGSFDNTELACL